MNDITITIPTMNRFEFLRRLLRYYLLQEWEAPIVVGTSSAGSNLESDRSIAQEYKRNGLDVTLFEYPGYRDPDVMEDLLAHVDTKYTAWTADDDFLIPTGLAQCVEFLESDVDCRYNAVHGDGVLFTLKRPGPYGPLKTIGEYSQASCEEETPEGRLRQHLEHYLVSHFSVHRTEERSLVYKDIPQLRDRAFAGELFPGCMSVVNGKVKHIPGLYLVRQSHDRRYLLPTFSDWMHGEHREESASLTVQRLAQVTGLSAIAIDKMFQPYYNQGLNGQPTRQSLKMRLRKVPGLGVLWDHLKTPEWPTELALVKQVVSGPLDH